VRRIQIADLDGCISDDRWRRHLILPLPPRGEDNNYCFQEYHDHCGLDAIANRHELDPSAELVILTARPISIHLKSADWLAAYELNALCVIHRNIHDYRASVDVKRDQLRWLFDPNSYGFLAEEIVSAIDDREDIVRMYREEFGLNSRIVRIGEEEGG
jgi:hypothetical protein